MGKTHSSFVVTGPRRLARRCTAFAVALAALFAILGCSSGQPAEREEEVRHVDTVEASFVPSERALERTTAQVVTLSMQRDVAVQRAEYLIATATGARFKATVTRRLARAGEEQTVFVADIDTGASVSWTLEEDSFTQVSSEGPAVTVTGDDAAQRLTISGDDGSALELDYAGLEPDSEAAQMNDSVISLALLGASPSAPELFSAMSSAMTVAAIDLDAPARGLGSWLKNKVKAVVKRVKPVLCAPLTKQICATMVVDGVISFWTGTSIVPALVGTGCLVLHSVIC